MSSFAVETSHDRSCRIRGATVVRGIARETWSHDEWDEVRIGRGFGVAVRCTCMDRGLGAPEVVVVLIEECSDQAVADRHVDQGESPSVFRERTPLLLRHLPCGLIECLGRRGGRVVGRDIGPIWWPLRAVEASYCHHLVVRFRVFVAPKGWRGREEKLFRIPDTERSDVLPLKGDSGRDSIHDGTTRCGLPFAWNRGAGYLESRGRRAIVGAKSNQGIGCCLARRDAVTLCLAVWYQSQRLRASRVEHRRCAQGEVGAEHPIGSLDGCCVR